jgi:hypothetical protein
VSNDLAVGETCDSSIRPGGSRHVDDVVQSKDLRAHAASSVGRLELQHRSIDFFGQKVNRAVRPLPDVADPLLELGQEWLFLHSLDRVATIPRLVAFCVHEYNTVLPQSAFRGRPPDEIYAGTGEP